MKLKKFSTQIDEAVLKDLKTYIKQSERSISKVVSEAVREYIAFAVTAIFLSMNGYRLKVDADNGESFLIGEVIQEKVSVEVIAGWLENHMKRTK